MLNTIIDHMGDVGVGDFPTKLRNGLLQFSAVNSAGNIRDAENESAKHIRPISRLPAKSRKFSS